MFSNCFILVRAVVDPEIIPATLGTRQEYTLNGTPVHQKVPSTHSHTHSHLRAMKPIHLLPYIWKWEEHGEPGRTLIWTRGEQANTTLSCADIR